MLTSFYDLDVLLQQSEVLSDENARDILSMLENLAPNSWKDFFPYIPQILSRLPIDHPNSSCTSDLHFDRVSNTRKLSLCLSESLEPSALPYPLMFFRAVYFAGDAPMYSNNVLQSLLNVKEVNIHDVYTLYRAVRESYVDSLLEDGDPCFNHSRLLERVYLLDVSWLVHLLHISNNTSSMYKENMYQFHPTVLRAAHRFLSSMGNDCLASVVAKLNTASSLNDIVHELELLQYIYNTFEWEYSIYMPVMNSYVCNGIGQSALQLVFDYSVFDHALHISQALPLLKALCSTPVLDLDYTTVVNDC